MKMPEEIIIKYKINNSKIKLFGKKFVDNNKNNCKIEINNVVEELKEFHEIENFKPRKKKKEVKKKEKKKFTISDFKILHKKTKRLEDEELEVKLKGIENITDMSYMFSKCKSLLSLDISKWKTSNVENMSFMFTHMSTLPNEISNINTSKVVYISFLFFKCKVVTLPDISKWETSKVQKMNNIFDHCESLETLPDISIWDTSNVTDMSSMFSKCKSLSFLPDISKWNTSKVNNMSCIFQNCSSLTYLPDISKWDGSNVGYKLYMFKDCISLSFIPDISKWKKSYFMMSYTIYSQCINSMNTHISYHGHIYN